MTNKPEHVNLMEVLLSFLVMAIHILSQPLMELNRHSLQLFIVYLTWKFASFVVPGFIFLSALKFAANLRNNFSYGAYIKKRFKTIFLPYLIWALIYYGYYIYIEWYTFGWHQLFMLVFLGKDIAHLYFVPIIFQFYLLAPIWIALIKRLTPFLLFVSFLLTLFFRIYIWMLPPGFGFPISFAYTDRIFTTYLFFWVLGMFAGTNRKDFEHWLKKNSAAVWIVYSSVTILHILLSFFNFQGKIFYDGAEFTHTLFCSLSIPAIYLLCLRLKKLKSVFGFFLALSPASFYIYLSHVLTIQILDRNVLFTSTESRIVLLAAVLYVLQVPLCLLYARLKAQVIKRPTAN